MDFINPNMFWGLLAIVVPVFLHFWHQRKGELLPWAATQFLSEKVLQQSKGFKLENILLLILRCFLLLSLILILVRPMFKSAHDLQTTWVMPDSKVVDAHKFEILEALKNGEKVFWLNGSILENLEEIPSLENLQLGINTISKELTGKEKAKIFLTNKIPYANYFVPFDYDLHILEDTLRDRNSYSLKLFDGRFLKMNSKGELDFDSMPSSHQIEGRFKTNIATDNSMIKAALLSLEKVYKLQFNSENSEHLTIYFLDHTPDNIIDRDLYFVMKNSDSKIYHSSVIYVDESKNSNLSLFPEFILEKLLHHLDIKSSSPTILKNQVEAMFSKSEKQYGIDKGAFSMYLLCAFLLLLIFERWISIKTNK